MCRMFFLLFLETQITECFPKIMEAFPAWILSFFLVVTTTIPPMIRWTNYCMHYICYFGIDMLQWDFYAPFIFKHFFICHMFLKQTW